MSASTLRPAGAPHPGGITGVTQALLICVMVAVGGFEALWFGVVTDTGLAAVDPVVVAWVVGHRSAGLVTVARVVSDIGGPTVMVTVAVMVLGWSVWRRAWRTVAFEGVGLGALIVVDVTAKSMIARPRPPVGWHAVLAQGYSFPSGHAILSVGVVLLICWFAHRHDLLPDGRGRQVALGGMAGGFLLAVGASRIVLGVHFPSDVLAGWLLAGLIVAAVAFADVASTRRTLA